MRKLEHILFEAIIDALIARIVVLFGFIEIELLIDKKINDYIPILERTIYELENNYEYYKQNY